jgi:glycogen debranching enzyme
MLAILAGVADAQKTSTALDLISRYRLAASPMKSIWPEIQPGEPDWRDYYGMLNLPGHYHNGGIWPFIGGFWVAALVRCRLFDEASQALCALADLNLRGGFNEWHHGHTGEPMGVRDQAWSAGMYLFAYECVRRGSVPWLE